MTKREHKVDVRNTLGKWSAKKPQEEVGTLQAKLDALGAEGWELFPQGAVPMTGTFTNNIGYGYLSLFKRSGS